MSFGNTPTTSTQSALLTNQFPLSSVAVPGTASGNLTALEGGPASTDSNGNQTAPASMYVKDGSDLAQGATTDAAVTTDVAATISAKLRGLVKISGDIWDGTNHRIRVDGSGVTQPISAVSLPLPAGAATSAKQPSLGAAGSASTDVITVQGIVSMTPLKVDGSGFTQPISGSVSVSNFPGTQSVSGTVTANAGTGTFNNQQSNVQLDYDSGVGTQNMTLFGVALPASGGAVSGGTSSNPLRIDPTGTTTQPVSGTVNAAQSGTWSITNISGTVSLPTGAATSAKQPALGTAGAASSDVLTVQGIASMTALKVDGSGVTQPVSGTFWQTTQPVSGTVTANVGATNGLALDASINGVLVSQASTTSGQKGPLIQGAVTTSAPTYTTAQTSPISLTTAGAVRVDGSGVTQPISVASLPLPSGAATSAKQPALGTAGVASSDVLTVQGIASMTALKVDGSAVTQPVSGTFWQATQPVSGTVTSNAGTGTFNNQQSNVTTDYDTGVGTQTMTMFGVALPASGGAVAGGTSSNPLRIDPTGTTTQPVSGTVNAAQSGTWTVQPGNTANTTAWKVDGSSVTQPVSGTITANIGTTNGLALDSSINGVLVSQGSTTSGQKGPLIQGAVTTAAPTYTTAQTSPISLTTAGAVRVDGSGVTQPVSAASLPLPSGAATSAKQPAIGTAGTASSDVLTVQGITSMTALKVDGSGVTQPVSGTVTANAGTGTFTNQQTNITADYDTGAGTQTMTMFGMALPASGGSVAGGTATNPVRTDPTGTTTQPISAASLPLPTGAATAAKQPVLGTAGSASTDVLTVQGITSMTALKVDGSAVTQPVSGTFWQTTQPVSGTITANIGTTNGLALDTSVNGLLAAQGSTTSGEKGPLIQGAVTTNAPTYTTAQTSPVSLDTSGLLRASLKDTPSNTNNFNVNLAASAATVTVSGTVTANAGTNLNTSALALESGGNLATLAGAVTSAKVQANVAQINGVAPSMGNGVSGTGVQRVTIASDSTGQVALAAGANTIGAVTQASGPWTSNVTQIAGSSISTAATGVQKVGIVGNAGATVDSTVAAGSAPTNAVVIGAVYNSSAPAPTSGQAMAVQADQAGNVRAFPGIALAALSAWNNGTALNTTQNIFTNSGAAAVLVQLTQTTTLTAGAITFEVSYDGSNWSTIPASCVLDPTSPTFAQISLPYTVQASTNKAILLNMNGAQGLRVKLSTQITGTGTVTPNYALLPLSPADTVIALSPTAANFNVSAAQSGTWNITNVSGTVSLPTGAATSAKQPALGTAGSASTDVITVQGIASMTALKVDGSGVTQPVSGTVTANQGGSNWSTNVAQIGGTNVITGGASGLLAVGGPVASGASNADNPVKIGGAFNTTQPTVTTGQIVDAQMTARGAQIVATGVDTFNATINAALPAGANVIGSTTIQATSGTALSADQSNTILKTSLYVKKTTAGDTALALGSATSANSVPVVIASDQAAVPASQSGTWTSVPNSATSGGSTPSHTISASGTNATNLKNSAGQVYGFSISNSNAAARYFKLYNTSAAPTVGTTTPIMTVQVPANGTVIRAFPVGLVFSTGISWGLTTGIADNDTGSVGTDISVDIDYK